MPQGLPHFQHAPHRLFRVKTSNPTSQDGDRHQLLGPNSTAATSASPWRNRKQTDTPPDPRVQKGAEKDELPSTKKGRQCE